jgi:purine-binding chemotaxis protein CheW
VTRRRKEAGGEARGGGGAAPASAPTGGGFPAGAGRRGTAGGGGQGAAGDSGRGAAGGSGRLALPSSGLAGEILAGLERAPAAGGGPAGGRERVYSFADALERRGQQAELPQEQPESWVVFALAGESYGLPVAAVQEILRAGTITRVPHAPAPVRGITHLRGRVLAVVDLRVRLGLPPAALDERSRILVVDSRQRVLGLLVDAALQVCKLLPSAFAPPPPDVMSERSDYLRGVVHLGEQLIIALDLDRVLLIQDEDLTPGATAAAAEEQPGD